MNRLPKIHEACSNNTLRPVMQRILIENGYAIATDAHILACIDLHQSSSIDDEFIDALNGKQIHHEGWKNLLKSYIFNVDDKGIYYENKGGVKQMYLFPENDLKFPNYKEVLKSLAESKKEPFNNFGINAGLLSKVASILDDKSIFIHTYENLKGFICHTSDRTYGFCILMPMKNEFPDFNIPTILSSNP